MTTPTIDNSHSHACLVLSLGGIGALAGQIGSALSLVMAAVIFATAIAVAVALLRKHRVALWLTLGFLLLLGPFAGPVLWCLLRKTKSESWDCTTVKTDVIETPAQRILAQIAQNRRPRYRSTAPVALTQVFAHGDLRSQQTAILALAHNYEPDLRPALDLALGSSIPAVRVQAAAVFAHLRNNYNSRARQLRDAPDRFDAAARRAEARILAKSGFVDPALTTRLLSEAGIPPKPIRTYATSLQHRAAA